MVVHRNDTNQLYAGFLLLESSVFSRVDTWEGLAFNGRLSLSFVLFLFRFFLFVCSYSVNRWRCV